MVHRVNYPSEQPDDPSTERHPRDRDDLPLVPRSDAPRDDQRVVHADIELHHPSPPTLFHREFVATRVARLSHPGLHNSGAWLCAAGALVAIECGLMPNSTARMAWSWSIVYGFGRKAEFSTNS